MKKGHKENFKQHRDRMLKQPKRLVKVDALRRRHALVFVALLIVLPGGIAALFQQISCDSVSSPTQSMRTISLNDSLTFSSQMTPEDVLDRIEELGKVGESYDQDALIQEIEIPFEATHFRFDSSTSIFSFELTGECFAVSQNLSELWALRGWKEVPLGGLNGSTFLKDEGIYRWMLITYTQVGRSVCVVGNPLQTGR